VKGFAALGVALGLAMLSAGCVTSSPLTQADVQTVKNSPTAVLFSDENGQIDYIEDHYYVLAVTQTASNSIYSGVWDSGKAMSTVVAEEFGKLGVKTMSVYDLLQGQDVAALKGSAGAKFAFGPDRATPKKEGTVGPAVSPELRDALTASGHNYLIWSTWSGPLVHIQTLGLPAVLAFNMSHRVVDLKRNEVIGTAIVNARKPVDLSTMTGKEYMEKGGLANLKADTAELMRVPFAQGIVSTEIGFTPKVKK
jgi:hypothetical protein